MRTASAVEDGATREHTFQIWRRNIARGNGKVKNLKGRNSGDAGRKKKQKETKRKEENPI
jgi:hypothetical protein